MWLNVMKSLGQVVVGVFKGFDWFFISVGVLTGVIVVDLLVTYFLKFRNSKREVIGHINNIKEEGFFEKLFILFPNQFWSNFYAKKKGQFNEHGIIMFTGRQGQGKTLAETKYLNDMRYKYPNIKIATNYGYKFENEQIDHWKKLVSYNNGLDGVICAIDECQNWFSSNMSKNFPPRMLATVTQNRKNRRVIIMSSHFFTNVAKPIRLHCTQVRACRTFLGCITIVHKLEPLFNGSGDVIKMKGKGYYWFVHSNKLYESYDTYKVIMNLAESGFQDDNFGIVQQDNGEPYLNKKSKRSTMAEHNTNYNIDSAFSSFD